MIKTSAMLIFMVILFWSPLIFLFVLIVRALLKYLRTGRTAKKEDAAGRSLGEAIKTHRSRCGMTQSYVAEALNVSRQAVSKWESGASAPSTSNLLALAKLFGISPEELLNSVE